MKNYITPAVALRGNVVRETLTSKPVFIQETSSERASSDLNLSFGL
jgi:hypothetical protein